jgi:hypothetical protein
MDFLRGGVGRVFVYLFTFVHILLVALFFVSFFICFDETENPYQPTDLQKFQEKYPRTKKSRDFCQMSVFPKRKPYPRVWI